MRKWAFVIIICMLGYFTYTNKEEITQFAIGQIIKVNEVVVSEPNEYKTNYEFNLVKNTENFKVTNRQEILDAIYTTLNNGWKDFTFYCDPEYQNCQDTVTDISNDKDLLSTINNMVSPYNSYDKLYLTTNSLGKINVNLENLYTEEDIEQLNAKIDAFEKKYINDKMTSKQKIKKYHDYIINISVYDNERAKNIEKGKDVNYKYNSHKANGPLLEGYALCSGYSDAEKIYLDRLNIPNYKISNSVHIWNLVYIDNKWLHLDLTWDDPVTSDGSNVLLTKFFLINTKTLQKIDPTNHSFNKLYYKEATM